MKPRMLRAAASILVLAVCSQVLVFASAREVCRFTGRTIAPCPCPIEHKAPPTPAIGDESCCLLLQALLPGLNDVVVHPVALASVEPVGVLAFPVWPPIAVASRHEGVRGTAGPPQLYMTLRQLLL